jgi:hypothetical protein
MTNRFGRRGQMSGKESSPIRATDLPDEAGDIRIIGRLNEEDLRLTEEQKGLLDRLFEWQNLSAKTRWILGETT